MEKQHIILVYRGSREVLGFVFIHRMQSCHLTFNVGPSGWPELWQPQGGCYEEKKGEAEWLCCD